jgi:hemolysin III
MGKEGRFTHKEELANSISHSIGVVFGIVALILMLVTTHRNNGEIVNFFSASVFGAGLIILFLSSTLNHSLPSNTKSKDFFHNFDQIAIYFLIAGTYTPLALVALKNNHGWSMFGIEWGFAFFGIIAKLFLPNKFEKGVNLFVIFSYLLLGWLLLFYIPQITANIPTIGLAFIFIGGGLYTFGIIFFLLEKKMMYSHLIWHVFVLAGAFCHWIAVWQYVLAR